MLNRSRAVGNRKRAGKWCLRQAIPTNFLDAAVGSDDFIVVVRKVRP